MMKEIAKQKDDGKYAKLGMMYDCASYFNVEITSECVLYIVETFLECIDTFNFFDWIRGADPYEKVIVMDKNFLKENFSDLLSFSEDLDTLSDLFMYLYNQDVWVDHYEKVLYSTVFDLSLKNRTRFNYVGIVAELERLCTLNEKKIIKWEDIDRFVENTKKYGYDIESDYDYKGDDVQSTVDIITDRMEQVFGLYW